MRLAKLFLVTGFARSWAGRRPLPQGGEGRKINSPLAPRGERGPGDEGGSGQHPFVKSYVGHRASVVLLAQRDAD